MIYAGKSIKDYINNQKSITAFADKVGYSRQAIYDILQEKGLSGETVAMLLAETGFSFDDAFVVTYKRKR